MAHNKVFGFCENLCNVEVIAKDIIAVITGTQELNANDSGSDYAQTTWNINYPEGFTKDNCICLAFQGSILRNNSKIGAYGTVPTVSGNLLLGTLPRAVSLLTNNINLQCYNPSSDVKQYDYKLVLMKVS